jgi:hypothetical protein
VRCDDSFVAGQALMRDLRDRLKVRKTQGIECHLLFCGLACGVDLLVYWLIVSAAVGGWTALQRDHSAGMRMAIENKMSETTAQLSAARQGLRGVERELKTGKSSGKSKKNIF